jgi:hypothetical protein
MTAIRRAVALATWTMTVAIACSSCGGKGTTCEEAASKMAGECHLGGGYALGPISECKDEVECRAQCVTEAKCDEITDTDQNPQTNSYADCLTTCVPQQPVP